MYYVALMENLGLKCQLSSISLRAADCWLLASVTVKTATKKIGPLHLAT